MCKLCNTDRPPVVNTREKQQKYKELIKKAEEVVKDYTGEAPCNTCRHGLIHNFGRNNSTLTLDEYILRRLYKSYYFNNVSKEEKVKTKRKRYYAETMYIKIEIPGIRAKKFKSGKVYYEAFISKYSGYECLGHFDTLEEALITKIQYLNNNPQHKKAINSLKNKLKELQNGQQ